MHYLLHVRLQAFYTPILREEYGGTPLVVFRDQHVLDACPLAAGAGVDVGMPLSEAKAILEKGAFVRWSPEPYRAAQTEWLDACADFTDTIEPLDQHTALLDLSEHPNPQAVANALIEHLESDLGYEVQAGTGNCRWIAELASSFGFGTDPMLRPARFVQDMSTHCLATVSPEHRQRLVFLGYSRVGDVARVPREVMREQFGDAAHEILRAARGGGDPAVRSLWPEHCASSRLSFDGPPQDVQSLLEGFDEAARQLAESLEERDLQGKEIQVYLEHEDGRATSLRRVFTRAPRTSEELSASLRLILREPPRDPVVGVRVRMPNLRKATRIQLGLDGQKSRNERELTAGAAFQHIRRVFGDTAILVAGQLPEPRRRRLLRLWNEATGWA